MKLFSKSGIALGLMVAASAMLAACGGGDDGIDDRLGLNEPQTRVIHAVPPIPTTLNLDVYQNGAKTSLQNIPYKFVARYSDVDDGNHLFTFNAAGTQTEVGRAQVDAATGHKYTIVALPGGDRADTLVIDDPYEKGLLSTKARVRAVNAAFNAQNVDIYVTAPSVDINTVSPTFANVGYKSAVPASGQDSNEFDGGNNYQIRVTTAGTKQVIFSSGAITIDNNADWLIMPIPVDGIASAVPNNIKVLVAKANDDSQTAIELVSQ